MQPKQEAQVGLYRSPETLLHLLNDWINVVISDLLCRKIVYCIKRRQKCLQSCSYDVSPRRRIKISIYIKNASKFWLRSGSKNNNTSYDIPLVHSDAFDLLTYTSVLKKKFVKGGYPLWPTFAPGCALHLLADPNEKQQKQRQGCIIRPSSVDLKELKFILETWFGSNLEKTFQILQNNIQIHACSEELWYRQGFSILVHCKLTCFSKLNDTPSGHVQQSCDLGNITLGQLHDNPWVKDNNPLK